jgi:hypothetical protein
MVSNKIKGDDLENSVEALERAILSDSPSLSHNKFTIEKRKIIIRDGVKHEIDIYIAIDLGNAYESINIFECKNWKAKVDKNEIIVFSEKVKVLGAQRGFFVAKSFTKYAEAQAKLDQRIRLLSVSDDKEVDFEIPDIIMEDRQITHIKVHAFEKGHEDSLNIVDLDFETLVFTIDSQERNFTKYLNDICVILMNEKLNTEPTSTFPENIYTYQEEKRLLYPEDNIKIDNTVISALEVTMSFKLRVIRPPISSSFNIKTRGRTRAIMPVTFPSGGTVSGIVFVQVEK